jgi:hypothetical protein
MKGMRVVVATCAVLAATASVAQADLVLINGTPALSFVDIGAQGFGAAPRLLTLQTSGIETGFETPIDVEHGDAINGANKSTTPTIGVLGWTSGAKVGIGFNSDQIGGAGITLNTLTLTIFGLNTTTVLGTFSLASPITFTAADLALQQGNGQAVFNFGLTATQQAQFNAIVAMAGSSGFYAGLGASLGCAAGAPAGCLPSNDGPDSFVGFAQSAGTVPDGGSALTLLGSALFAVGMLRRKLGR